MSANTHAMVCLWRSERESSLPPGLRQGLLWRVAMFSRSDGLPASGYPLSASHLLVGVTRTTDACTTVPGFCGVLGIRAQVVGLAQRLICTPSHLSCFGNFLSGGQNEVKERHQARGAGEAQSDAQPPHVTTPLRHQAPGRSQLDG